MKGLLALLISSMVLPAHAGIVIYGTRIIYPAENKEVMVQLMNQWKPFFAAAGVD